MARLLSVLASLTALPLLTLAALAVAGIAVARQPSPLAVAAATTLLLLLPVLGCSALLPNRAVGLLIGANLWPILLLTGLPLFFPGERAAALELGLALLGQPLGASASEGQLRVLAHAIDAALAAPRARPPSPQAEPARKEPLPPSRLDQASDQVALPYEGRGHSLVVPVTVEGPRGEVLEIEMLFDTGATYTTLDRATLARAGYQPADDAPSISFQTATGSSTANLAVLDRLWIGGFEVPGVTVAICDTCGAEDGQAGLLGLNVSGRFLITLDTARQELILEPRADARQAPLDIRPWLALQGRGTSWPDGHTEIEVSGRNLAGRAMGEVAVEVRCGEDRFALTLGPFGAREEQQARASIPSGIRCDPYAIDLVRGAW